MKRYDEICKEIRVEPPAQKLLKNNTKFICKIMHKQRVRQILEMLIINPQTGTKVDMVNPQKTNSKSAILKHVQLYNALPLKLKSLNPDRLKQRQRTKDRQITQYISLDFCLSNNCV